MIKKLIKFICFAAVLMLSAQFLTAQDVTAINPTSPTSTATQGRIRTDVDLFMGVNDWADVQMDNWFSYLRADAINTPQNWQAGVALKLPQVYIGLSYYGRFNVGAQSEGSITEGSGNLTLGGADSGVAFTNNPAINTGVGNEHQNYFGLLVGLGNHGIKLTVLDTLTAFDYRNVTSDNNLTTNGTRVPEGLAGYYRTRDGEVTPRLTWGAAKPMQLGKFSTKPNVFVEFAINYDDEQEWEFEDGDDVYGYESLATNSMKPKLGVDTGSIGFLEGDWGKVTAGLSEEITVGFDGEGTNFKWENQLKPYVGFTYNPVSFFRMGARLDVPILAGWDGNQGNYFGIGAKGLGTNPKGQVPVTLKTGFQVKGGVFEKVAEKIGVIDKLDFNFGIAVNLPGYLYEDTAYDYTVGAIVDNPSHTWFNSVNNVLQSVSAGVTFSITPKIVLDWTISGVTTPSLTAANTLLLSIKH